MLMSPSRIQIAGPTGGRARSGTWSRFALAGAVAAVAMLLAACHKEKPEPPKQAIEVTTMTVEQRDTPVDFEFTAQTQSSREVEIRARVDGFLDKRVYTEGSLVHTGQTLFLMDTEAVRSGAAVGAGVSSRSSRRGSPSTKANLARVVPLVAQNALSQKDLDDATGNEKEAEAAVIAAQGTGPDG